MDSPDMSRVLPSVNTTRKNGLPTEFLSVLYVLISWRTYSVQTSRVHDDTLIVVAYANATNKNNKAIIILIL